jgi:hypothetical protein
MKRAQCEAICVTHNTKGKCAQRVFRPSGTERCLSVATLDADGHCVCWVHWTAAHNKHRTVPMEYVAP